MTCSQPSPGTTSLYKFLKDGILALGRRVCLLLLYFFQSISFSIYQVVLEFLLCVGLDTQGLRALKLIADWGDRRSQTENVCTTAMKHSLKEGMGCRSVHQQQGMMGVGEEE